MQYNVDAWQIIRVPNRYLSQGLVIADMHSLRINIYNLGVPRAIPVAIQ